MNTLLPHSILSNWASANDIDLIGAALAAPIPEAFEHYSEWLRQEYHQPMTWLERYQSIRNDITLLMPGTRSVIMLAVNYYSDSYPAGKDKTKISRYVTQRDYHSFLKEKLYQLLKYLQTLDASVVGRPFTDSAPVFEKAWAVRAGLGWIGKNSNLIHPRYGSWLFLGGMVLNFEFDHYDTPMENHCGRCHRCLDACPVKAFPGPFRLDARKCISAQTIENKETNLTEKSKLFGWIYGCDICQDVCPWNIKFARTTQTEELFPAEAIHSTDRETWLTMTGNEYKRKVKGTAMTRQTYQGLHRNILHPLK